MNDLVHVPKQVGVLLTEVWSAYRKPDKQRGIPGLFRHIVKVGDVVVCDEITGPAFIMLKQENLMEPTQPMTRTDAPTLEEAKRGRVSSLKSELRNFITEARGYNRDSNLLRGRPLSEAITCAETAYLWLDQIITEGSSLDF